MSEKQLFEVFSPKSGEVVAVPTILKMAYYNVSGVYSISIGHVKKPINFGLYLFLFWHDPVLQLLELHSMGLFNSRQVVNQILSSCF